MNELDLLMEPIAAVYDLLTDDILARRPRYPAATKARHRELVQELFRRLMDNTWTYYMSHNHKLAKRLGLKISYIPPDKTDPRSRVRITEDV